VTKEVLLPLEFKEEMNQEKALELDSHIFDDVDREKLPNIVSVTVPWNAYNYSGTQKHPVVPPIRGSCFFCGAAATSIVPELNANDKYPTARLISLKGAANVHLCRLKCKKCGSILQEAYGGSTSWLLVHGIIPATPRRAEVVFCREVVTFLATLEKAHPSTSVTSQAALLYLYFTEFERSSNGLPFDSEISQRSLEDGLALVMPRTKGAMVFDMEVKEQKPQECPGCRDVECCSSDANVNAVTYFRVGVDMHGTGKHYTDKLFMGRSPIDEMQVMYGE